MTSDTIRYPRYRWLILVAAALTYANAQIINLSITTMLGDIATDLGISPGIATNFMWAFLISGCIIMFTIGGAVGDRLGILPALLIGLLAAVLPGALMPWIGKSYLGVFWIRVIQGFSPGFIFPVMGAIIAIWFPMKEKGLATGLMSAMLAAGSAAGTFVAPLVYAAVDTWQQMSAWITLIGWLDVIFIVLLLFSPKPRPPVQSKAAFKEANWKEYLIALAAPITLMIILVNFMASWNMHCLYGIAPTFLSISSGAGYGDVTAGLLMINVTVVSGILGPIVCGFFVDRVFRGDTKQVFAIGFVLCCIFMYAIKTPFFYENKVLISLCLALAGFGVQFIMPSVYIFIARSYRHRILAKMTGLVMGIGTLGGVLGQFVSGITLEITGRYSLAFIFMSLAALVGLLFSFILPKMKPLVRR